MNLFSVVILLVSQPSVDELLQHLDELYRSEDSHARMTMEVVTEHWERTLELEAWSSGQDKTFILIHSPAREAGSATLRDVELLPGHQQHRSHTTLDDDRLLDGIPPDQQRHRKGDHIQRRLYRRVHGKTFQR